MSLITITVNTEDKSIALSIDGEIVEGNIKEIRAYKYEHTSDEPRIDFYACVDHEKIGKISKITTFSVYANAGKETVGKDKDVFISESSAADWSKFLK